MTYLPFDNKINFIDTFSYKICNELCPDLCNEAKVIINFDKDAVGTKDIYKGYSIYELLKLEPCKVQLFNTMGQQIYGNYSCDKLISTLQDNEILSGLYFYQITLKNSHVVYGSFIKM